MATITKREWTNKKGQKTTRYQLSYFVDGVRYKKQYRTQTEALAEYAKISNTKRNNKTIKDISRDYLDNHCLLHCKESTKDLYENYFKVYFDTIKKKKIAEFNKRDVERFIIDLKQRDLKNKSINNVLIFLGAVFQYAVENCYLSSNIVKTVKKLPVEKKAVTYFSDEQIPVFLEVSKRTVPELYYVLFATAIFSGMRRGELFGLNESDINFRTNKIRVCKQVYRGKVTSTKTYNTRYIDMSETLSDILKQYIRGLKVHGKFLFAMPNGRSLHAWNMEERYFKKVIKQIEFEYGYDLAGITFHSLRHTYATYLLSHNVPVKYVQEQLGHSTSRTTMDIYNHAMPTIKDKAMNVLDMITYENATVPKTSQS